MEHASSSTSNPWLRSPSTVSCGVFGAGHAPYGVHSRFAGVLLHELKMAMCLSVSVRITSTSRLHKRGVLHVAQLALEPLQLLGVLPLLLEEPVAQPRTQRMRLPGEVHHSGTASRPCAVCGCLERLGELLEVAVMAGFVFDHRLTSIRAPSDSVSWRPAVYSSRSTPRCRHGSTGA